MTAARDLPFPGNEVLAALALMHVGEQMRASFCYWPDDDFFAVEFPDGRRFRVEFEHFDAVVARGWVNADGNDVVLTESGKWTAKKWLRKNTLEVQK